MDNENLIKEEFEPSTSFNPDLLSNFLNHCIFNKNIIFKETIESTNVFLKTLAQQGFPEGTIVIADDQTDGLGRLGRKWFSKKYENLLFSILLRPQLTPNRIFFLTMIFALAGVDAIQQMTGLNAMIKWPNDIYIGEKKLGGILTEFAVKNGVVQHVVLGMGLNVNWNPSKEQDLMYTTSSLFDETHQKVAREELLSNLLKKMENYYHNGIDNKKNAERFFEKWNQKSVVLGKSVVIESGKGRVEGRAADIDQEGALTLITADGQEKKIVCGDVSIKMKFSEQ